MIDLQPIKARLNKATHGMWTQTCLHKDLDIDSQIHCRKFVCVNWNNENIIAEAKREGDAEFIAHSHLDISLLISEVENLRKTQRQLETNNKALHKELDDLYRTNPFYKEKPDA